MNPFISYVIIAVLVIGIIGITISLYNRLVMSKFNVEKAFANIDVLLKQRADEIPNLINVVKEFTHYEESVLTKLTSLRTDFLNSTKSNDKIELSNEISSVVKSLFAVTENYPDLKANKNYLRLQTRASEIEDAISDRREFFNESVNMYNIGIHEFPNLILANLMAYKDKSLLVITEQEKEYDGIKF